MCGKACFSPGLTGTSGHKLNDSGAGVVGGDSNSLPFPPNDIFSIFGPPPHCWYLFNIAVPDADAKRDDNGELLWGAGCTKTLAIARWGRNPDPKCMLIDEYIWQTYTGTDPGELFSLVDLTPAEKYWVVAAWLSLNPECRPDCSVFTYAKPGARFYIQMTTLPAGHDLERFCIHCGPPAEPPETGDKPHV